MKFDGRKFFIKIPRKKLTLSEKIKMLKKKLLCDIILQNNLKISCGGAKKIA